MKCIKAVSFLLAIGVYSQLISCSEKDDGSEGSSVGKLTGIAKKKDGTALNNVKIIIDNSIFFNSNITTHTNSEGNYSITVPTGSWYAFAQHQVTYNGKQYTIYLNPNNDDGFGREGGVRNFTWELTGEMPSPLAGTFGGLVSFDNFPGDFVENEREINWRFEPLGNLIDGSAGQVITRLSADGDTIQDLPIGKYRISATYQGQALRLRKWNTEETFQSHLDMDFEPVIDAQCFNCMKLEYRK